MSLKLVAVGLVILGAVMVGVAQITGGNGAKLHPLGTEVVVGHKDVSEGQRGVRTQIALTVLAVRTGTQEELEENGFRLDPDEKDATPYYIYVRFANKGPNTVKRNLHVGLEDSGGNLIRSPIVFRYGDRLFEQCPESDDGTLKSGETYESCTLALVPKGVDAAKVHFLSDNGPNEEPELVYWATE